MFANGNRRSSRKEGRRPLVLRLLGTLFATSFIVFCSVAAGVGYVIWDASRQLPDYTQLAQYEPPVMSRIHAADGSLLAEYAAERRLFVPINAIPQPVVEAFISAEDKNYYQHSGIDWEALTRAVVQNAVTMVEGGNRRLVGASTITQQVAKNFLLTSDRTFDRKLKEALLARRIEWTFSKDQILELYLNEIFLGLGSYGVAAASLNYFGKSLTELSLAETAYLAALPKAPNNYHPYRFRERAIERRNWVLDRMLENGYVSQAAHDAAVAEPLNVTLRPFGAQMFAAESFSEEVRRQVQQIYGDDKLYSGGLTVRTTLEPRLQLLAREALTAGLIRFDRRKGFRGAVTTLDVAGDWGARLGALKIPADLAPWRLAVALETSEEAAIIGLQPKLLPNGTLDSGREKGRVPLALMEWARRALAEGGLGPPVKAVGDVLAPGDVVYVAPADAPGDWALMQLPQVEGAFIAMDPHTGRVLALAGGFSYGMSQFNRAVQAMRQPGSAIKPFVYAAALDNNYTPASVVLDAPVEFKLPTGEIWKPRNYTGKYYGPSTLRRGIELSRNVMTVRLASDMGLERFGELAERLGIYDHMPRMLAMSLGAGETTLLKMVAAYSMIANGGKKIEASLIDRIQDRYGRTIYRHDQRECIGCNAESWQDQPEPELIDNRLEVINPYTAYQITSMLEGVVQHGTGQALKSVGKPIAGKTGTSNEERDAWFIGFTPDLAVGVYVGYDTPKPMGKGSTGGEVAAPIVAQFMKAALRGVAATPFRVPAGIQLIPIDPATGQRAPYGEANVILEAFKPGDEPLQNTIVIGEGQVPIDGNAAVIEGGLTTGTGGLY
jgi:penicillin-binding protein 1A